MHSTGRMAHQGIFDLMHCKRLSTTAVVAPLALRAVGWDVVRVGLLIAVAGLCPWVAAKARDLLPERAVAASSQAVPGAAARSAPGGLPEPTTSAEHRTLTSALAGMEGDARVVLTGGGPNCALEPGGGFAHPPVLQPQGVRMPYGMLAFSAIGCQGSVTVQLTYPEPLPPRAQLWKLGPAVKGAAAPTWFAWGGAQFSADRRTVTYTVEDNGVGDSDPAVGRISDPATVALVPWVALPTPQDNSWALWAAAAILGLMLWLDLRSRPRITLR